MKNKVVKLSQQNLNLLPFFTILLLGILVRLYRLEEIPPPIHIDESFMTQSAIALLEKSKNLLETYFSAPIVANIFTAFFIKLFGVHVITLRMQSVLLGIGTNILLYLLVKDLFNRRLAFISFFIGTFSHLAIAYSRINIPPIQAPFFLILTLYLLNLAIKRKSTLFFFLGGLSTGLSLYSYTGAKIVVIVGLAFLCMHYKKLRWKNWLLFFGGLLVMALPLIIYIAGPNNYLQRESEAALFTKPGIFYARWGTTDIFTIFYQQLKINFLGFINVQDYSNQYGNGILLDKLSNPFFLLFFILFISTLVYQYKQINRNILNISFFVVIFFFIISLVSLTESPPLSTRLLILYPIVVLFISWTLDTFYKRLTSLDKRLAKLFICSILLVIFVLNIIIYFYDYLDKKNAYYQWIEPNSSIALHIQKSPYQNIYILNNSHTYAQQPIISVLNYASGKNIKNLSGYGSMEKVVNKESRFEVIMPLVPQEAVIQNYNIEADLYSLLKDKKFTKTYYWGIPCKNCDPRPIFISFQY